MTEMVAKIMHLCSIKRGWQTVISLLALINLNRAFATDDPYCVTQAYYQQLIQEPQVRIAELSLFMNQLPKGRDLHHHYAGALYAERYLEWAEREKYCTIADGPQKFHIGTGKNAATPHCPSVKQVRSNDDFYRTLLQTWSDKGFYNHSHQQKAPDKHFFDTFFYFSPLTSDLLHEGLQSLKRRAIAENVQYLETMVDLAPSIENPTFDATVNKLVQQATPSQKSDEVLRAYIKFMEHDTATQQKIHAYVKMMEDAAHGIDDVQFMLRIQAYVLRNLSPAQVFTSMYVAFKAAQDSPLVVGVNIVGPENEYVAMGDYALHMHMFAFLHKSYPNVKLALHAGELTLGMVPPEGLRFHIRDAVQTAGALRIGHGVDIAYEDNAPELLKLLRQKGIPIEINLTSNQFILGVKDAAHPIMLYRRFGVPFVISSDDAGVSRNTLSGEYLLYASRYKPSYQELKSTVMNSIRYSFLSDAEKARQLQILKVRFAAFEQTTADMLESAPPPEP